MLTLCKPGHHLATRWNVCFMWGFSYEGLDLFSIVLWTLPPGKKIAELPCSSSTSGLWYCLSMFPIWIVSLSAVIRKVSLAVANTADERCKRREGIYDFSAFLTIRQPEKKELQAYVQIKLMNTRKRVEARKSSLYLGKWWVSHWIPMLFVWERLMFSGCIIYSFAYLKSSVVFTLS